MKRIALALAATALLGLTAPVFAVDANTNSGIKSGTPATQTTVGAKVQADTPTAKPAAKRETVGMKAAVKHGHHASRGHRHGKVVRVTHRHHAHHHRHVAKHWSKHAAKHAANRHHGKRHARVTVR